MPPADRLIDKVRERFIAVLSAITAGSDYYYTPYAIRRRFTLPEEFDGTTDKPVYSVFLSGGGSSGFAGHEIYKHTFYMIVQGIIKDAIDPGKKVIRAIGDVQKAINNDSKSGASGSLHDICVQVRIDEPAETDDGYLSVINLGYFEQKFRCEVWGNYGEI